MRNAIQAAITKFGVIACVLVMNASPIGEARADAMLKFEYGGLPATVLSDNGSGVISYFGTFAVNSGQFFRVAASQVLLMGSESAPNTEFTLAVLNDGSSGTLNISFTQTGLTTLDAGLDSFLSGGFVRSNIGTFVGNARISSFLDTSNTPFGMTTALGFLDYSPEIFLEADFTSGTLPTAFPYSITQVITLTLPAVNAGATLGTKFEAVDLQPNPVPIPASLILLSSGLIGWGFSKRRTATTFR